MSSIVPSILGEIEQIYNELLAEQRILIDAGDESELIESINDELIATARTYNDIATGNVAE